MRKKIFMLGLSIFLSTVMIVGCGSKEKQSKEEKSFDETMKNTEIKVFIAKSLNDAMDEIAVLYKEKQPNVSIIYNADSSGTLQTQIEEGFECDIYFSAAKKQMDTLEEKGYIETDSITNLLGNKLCLITSKDSNTKVTGFLDMNLAENIALADGSVPVGKYTRQVLINLGMLTAEEETDPADVTTEQVKEALSGIEINECANVGAVTEAVKEGANEIGTVYYSDAYLVKDDIKIIEEAKEELLGSPICYPLALVKNSEASEIQAKQAKEFYEFLLTDECMEIFKKYMFLEYKE